MRAKEPIGPVQLSANSYRISGLAVQSEIGLPGVVEAAAAAPDVTIHVGRVPRNLPGPEQQGGDWQIARDHFLLDVPGVARFLLMHGREIICEPAPGSRREDVATYISGTVFGILLHQRGHVVLHAGAVQMGDRAVLFCGSSGAGKSTLAAALARRGHPVLSDDFCVIETGSDRPVVSSDGRFLKLWLPAIEYLELGARQGPTVGSQTGKFYVTPPGRAHNRLILGAIYELRGISFSEDPDIRIERVPLIETILLLRANAYRPPLVAAMRQEDRYFRAAALIASRANVFRLSRPLDLTRLSRVTDHVEKHAAELGFTSELNFAATGAGA